MILIKEFIVLVLLTILVEARRRSEIRDETRKSMSAKSQKNFDSTIQGLKRLNRLQRRLLGLKNKTETDDNDNVEEGLEDPMANPDLFQGDVILTEKQVNEVISDVIKQAEEKNINVSDIENKTDILMREKRDIMKNLDFEWTFPIPYYVDAGVNATIVQKALAALEAETCIRFTRSLTPITDKAGLRYFKGNGCYSYIGRIFESLPQDVSIGQGCGFHGIVQHETSHALGVKHEQSRPDRDDYVTIFPENITPGKEGNFFKNSADSVLNYGIRYDYGSVMQYKRTAFTKNKLPTITSKLPKYDKTLGQNVRYGYNDLKLLNSKYCDSICPTKITCYNGGYQNPNNCSVCKCPPFFTGGECLKLIANTAKACGTQFLTATTAVKKLTISGAIKCFYNISTVAGSHVKLAVNSANLINNDPCHTGKGLEIKFKNDQTLTGYNFCGAVKSQYILSEGNTILLHYVGTVAAHTATISYFKA